MNEKKLGLIKTLALSASVVVTMLAIVREAGWSIGPGTLGFILWAISPYICFFFADILLRKLFSVPKLSLFSCLISLLMLAFTLVTYLGTVNDGSSTYPLIFLVLPIYLYVGSFILLASALILGLLFRRFQK